MCVPQVSCRVAPRLEVESGLSMGGTQGVRTTVPKSGYLWVTLPAPLAEVPRVLNRFLNKKTNPLSRKHRLFGSLWEETGAFGTGVPALGTGPSTPIVRRLF